MRSLALALFLAWALSCTSAPVRPCDGNVLQYDGNACAEAAYRSVAAQTCLITGISGMIGSYIAREVQSRGCRVHGIVRFRTHWGNLGGMLGENVTLHKGDITDATFVRRTIDAIRPGFIFHLAAQSLNGVSSVSPFLTLQVNVLGTMNVLEAVRELGLASHVRIFNAGSSTVYGKTADEWDGPIPEHAPMQPVTPYGVSKVTQELLGQQYHHAHKLHVVTGRFFLQVAPGGPETLAIQDFAMQLAMVELGVRSEPTLFHGNLETLRDMTDVRDSSKVMVDLAERSANMP